MRRGYDVTLVVAALFYDRLLMQSDSRLTTYRQGETHLVTDHAQKIFYLAKSHLLLATSGQYQLNWHGHAATFRELTVWLAYQKRLKTLPQMQAGLVDLVAQTPLADNQFLLGGFIGQQAYLSRYDHGWQTITGASTRYETTYIGQGQQLSPAGRAAQTPAAALLTHQLTTTIVNQSRTQSVPTVGGPLQRWCLTAEQVTHLPVI